MKDLTPNQIALRIAFLVALSTSLVFFLLEYFKVHTVIVTLSAFSITFLISYFGFRITIEKFIYKKIKLIYRIIHNLKFDKTKPQKDINLNTNVLNEVKNEVENWNKTNKEEIERLKGLELYRREFVGNVSHELKTPIFNIQGYLLTLLEGGLEDPNINVNYLERANKSVDRMITLIKNLDEITKLEPENIEINISKVDIIPVIKEIINSLEMQAQKKNITISFDKEPYKPVWVMADSDKIMQVLTNLFVNSIKYGKENGETLVKLFDMHDNILIEIADNGIGISEEHLPRLFERFYRTDKGRNRKDGGSGLGLSIVKHIIEAHNQTINVRSTVGFGSTFSFTLKKE